MSLASPLRKVEGRSSFDGGFKRLPDPSGRPWGHSHNVAVDVRGGRGTGSEDYEIEEQGSQTRMPERGIMVKTTMIQEIYERLNYHDELF